jgi:hypothetical protein
LHEATATAEREHSNMRADYQERINLAEMRNHKLQSELEALREEDKRRSDAREVAEARTVQDATAKAQSDAHAQLLASEARCQELEEEIARAVAVVGDALSCEPIQDVQEDESTPSTPCHVSQEAASDLASEVRCQELEEQIAQAIAAMGDLLPLEPLEEVQKSESTPSRMGIPPLELSRLSREAPITKSGESLQSSASTKSRLSVESSASCQSVHGNVGPLPSPRPIMERVKSLQRNGVRSATATPLTVPRSSRTPTPRAPTSRPPTPRQHQVPAQSAVQNNNTTNSNRVPLTYAQRRATVGSLRDRVQSTATAHR